MNYPKSQPLRHTAPNKQHPPSDLRIELAAPPHWTFAPGDTVIGTIVRTSHLVTPKATLEVRLTGYTETQISEFVGTYNKYNSTGLDMFGTTDMYGRSTKNHRAVWDILPVWTYEVLYNKTLHIAQGQAQDGTQDGTQADAQPWSIPFEVTIPAHPGRKEIMRHHKPEESYLPIDEESVASQTLPGSFLACKPLGYTSDISCDAVISYQIEARLRYTHGGKPEVIKAVCPVTVRHAQRPPEYDSDRLVYKRSLAATIQTHRLVPALRDKNARLSFSQKRQQFFGSSKVPQYTFRVEFGLPHSLFLAGPGAAGDADESAIPLTVAIIPDPNPNRTSASLQGVVQTLQVRSVRVSLDAVTEVRVVSGYGNKKIRTAQTVYPHAVSASMLSPSQRGPVDLVASHEKATSAVDIGALIGLRMGGKGLRRNGTSYQFDKEALYPDFTSYLIKHSHKLSCEVEICLAEESKWVKTTAAVVVN